MRRPPRTIATFSAVRTVAFGWVIGVAFAGVLLTAAPALAHPDHLTVAGAEWNPETRSLEVSLRVFTEDLDAAVKRAAKQSTRRFPDSPDLADLPDDERAIARYALANFRCFDKSGAAVRATWVGQEFAVDTTWLYFEFAMPKGAAGVECEQRFFLELHDDQTQIINVRHAEGWRSVVLDARTPRRPLGIVAAGKATSRPSSRPRRAPEVRKLLATLTRTRLDGELKAAFVYQQLVPNLDLWSRYPRRAEEARERALLTALFGQKWRGDDAGSLRAWDEFFRRLGAPRTDAAQSEKRAAHLKAIQARVRALLEKKGAADSEWVAVFHELFAGLVESLPADARRSLEVLLRAADLTLPVEGRP